MSNTKTVSSDPILAAALAAGPVEWVPAKGAGRPIEPNPFEALVKHLATLMADEAPNYSPTLPIPMEFETGDYEDRAKEAGKVVRQMRAAGSLCDPAVTVQAQYDPIPKPGEGNTTTVRVRVRSKIVRPTDTEAAEAAA